jgi:hypothetical protein
MDRSQSQPILDRNQIVLEVRQQPMRAQVVPESSTKPRKPIDPPPVIELKYNARDDGYNKEWLVSPRAFMKVELYQVNEDHSVPALVGQLTSSLFKLKERNSADKGEHQISGARDSNIL